jgi:hypothetical protein
MHSRNASQDTCLHACTHIRIDIFIYLKYVTIIKIIIIFYVIMYFFFNFYESRYQIQSHVIMFFVDLDV